MLGRRLKQLIQAYKLLGAVERVEALERRMDYVEDLVRRVVYRDEFDALKSKLDVPEQLTSSFQEWKARHPIPAHPLVSVIVTTYNRAQLLTQRCIPSILNQTYCNLELIVVGDCCTDQTEALVSGIADPRVKFHNLPVRGPYPTDPGRRWMVAGMYASSYAFGTVEGDFVTHLDDDDEYTLDRLEKLVSFAVSNSCDLVYHPFWMEVENGKWVLNEAREFAYAQVTNASVLYRAWFTNIKTNPDSSLLLEPGDWNRFRRMKYLNPVLMRFPEPLLKHYRQGTQMEVKSS